MPAKRKVPGPSPYAIINLPPRLLYTEDVRQIASIVDKARRRHSNPENKVSLSSPNYELSDVADLSSLPSSEAKTLSISKEIVILTVSRKGTARLVYERDSGDSNYEDVAQEVSTYWHTQLRHRHFLVRHKFAVTTTASVVGVAAATLNIWAGGLWALTALAYLWILTLPLAWGFRGSRVILGEQTGGSRRRVLDVLQLDINLRNARENWLTLFLVGLVFPLVLFLLSR